MPWTCPACQAQVQHSTTLPQTGRVYRCPVCRLNMAFDPAHQMMKPLPPNGNDNGDDPRQAA